MAKGFYSICMHYLPPPRPVVLVFVYLCLFTCFACTIIRTLESISDNSQYQIINIRTIFRVRKKFRLFSKNYHSFLIRKKKKRKLSVSVQCPRPRPMNIRGGTKIHLSALHFSSLKLLKNLETINSYQQLNLFFQ